MAYPDAFPVGTGVTQLAAAATGILLSGPTTGGLIPHLIQNANAATLVAVAFAPTAAAAQTNAAVPTSGNTAAGGVFVVPAASSIVVLAPPGQYWSSSATLVYVTPGN